MYAKVNKKKNSKDNTPTHKETPPRPEPIHAPLDVNSGYESLQSGRHSVEPNYESVTSNTLDSDSASGYAVVAPKNSNNPGYELVRNPARNSLHLQTDPNYEELGLKSEPVHEPNYEMLNGEPNYEPLKSSSSTQDDPNYESVSSLLEPPYERLDQASESAGGDILYATVNKSTKKTK
jgi:hypothetical protein